MARDDSRPAAGVRARFHELAKEAHAFAEANGNAEKDDPLGTWADDQRGCPNGPISGAGMSARSSPRSLNRLEARWNEERAETKPMRAHAARHWKCQVCPRRPMCYPSM